MNLADAIRRATTKSAAFREPQGWPDLNEEPKIMPTSGRSGPRPSNETGLAPVQVPEPPTHEVTAGNAIRLEIFLSGEQMTTMLKAIMAGQHTVLTLREAAAYLRIGSKALQRLVEDGEIPALEIDGRYRFPKTNLDDWMTMKTATTEEKKDVA